MPSTKRPPVRCGRVRTPSRRDRFSPGTSNILCSRVSFVSLNVPAGMGERICLALNAVEQMSTEQLRRGLDLAAVLAALEGLVAGAFTAAGECLACNHTPDDEPCTCAYCKGRAALATGRAEEATA